MDSMSAIHLRGICANYFEMHVSPILKYIQQSQERHDNQLEEIKSKLSIAMDSLHLKADADKVPSFSDIEKAVSGSAPRGEGVSVSVLSRLQDLSTLVSKKADASEISRLSALVEQKATFSKRKSDVATSANMENLTTLVDQKLEIFREPTLKQIENISARVEKLVAALEKKAEVKDVPTLEQWERLEKDVRTSPISLSPAKEEKSELKKVQMLVAAAGARFDRQLKELRQQIREVKDRTTSEQVVDHVAGLQAEDPRWPGRVIRSSTDDDVDSADGGRSHCESISESLAGSVTGLGPEERAELTKIQAVVGAAGTAFSKEIRELKKQLNVLSSELTGLKQHVSISNSSAVGA